MTQAGGNEVKYFVAEMGTYLDVAKSDENGLLRVVASPEIRQVRTNVQVGGRLVDVEVKTSEFPPEGGAGLIYENGGTYPSNLANLVFAMISSGNWSVSEELREKLGL